MRKIGFIALCLAFVAGPGANAFAAALTDTAILKSFNAVVDTDGSTPSDIEGAAVFGGNFSGATLYNNPTVALPTGYGALTVFGSTYGNGMNMNNGGNAYVAGAQGAHISFNGGGGYISAPLQTISDFWTQLTSLSVALSKLAATGSLPSPNNNEVITAQPNASGIAVFDLTAADLAAIPSYNLVLNGAKTVVFNVTGDPVDFHANVESGLTGADNTIWNFYQADTVDLYTLIPGTVLAVNANVTNYNQIDGDLISNSWTGSGELHSYAFTGPLPPLVIASAAPEPAAWALMLIGVGAMGFAMRRSKRTPLAGLAAA
jgi:choice-of-anchor A domain-containing protein